MTRSVTRHISALLVCLLTGVLWISTAYSAEKEKITLRLPGGKAMKCEILSISKSEVKVKGDGDREMGLPLGLLSPKEVLECYRQVLDPKNAALRFDMGSYFIKKELIEEGKTELTEAAKLDPKLKDKVADLLKMLPGAPVPVTPVVAEPKKTTPPPEKVKEVASGEKPKPPLPIVDKDGNMMISGSDMEALMKDGDFMKRMQHRDVPARTEAQMKEFLDKRLADLTKIIGGKWRLIETKHYYCFANVPEQKHTFISNQWNEPLYDMLCKILRHKDGDKLWNNKLPIYYFETFKQFQRFAVEIDQSPGAANSGGYFASQGREVHVAIPFMTERYRTNLPRADEMARSTLCHEGTHAFLQLSGEDVPLSKWLHEGMAQFIEYLFNDPKNPDKRDNVGVLRASIAANKGTPLSWDETKERPMGGMDSEGYSNAYAKLEFFYRNFDHQCLPQMIRLIKSGKSETEAIETVFKVKINKLEYVYRDWVKEACKINFNFPQP
ncbi:MAG: hypothetical protein WCT04_05560 [Planctomycetota bacterium]